MISCSEAVEQLWDYLDRDMTARDRDAVEQHLAFCRRCCGEVEFAEELRALLASAADVELPAGVEAQLTAVLDDLAETPLPAPTEALSDDGELT